MRSIARYRAWALREPFVLQLEDGSITISRPNSDRLFLYAATAGLKGRIRVLAGAQAAELLAVLGPENVDVARAVLDDMAACFGCSEITRLASIVDRYGDAIAADLLAEYQLDLLDVFRGDLLPDEVLTKIDQLPRHSRFAEAIAQDDELAEAMGDAPVGSAASVKFTEWTPEVERLTVIANSIGALFQAVASFAGSRAQLPQLGGPVGASERFKERQLELEFNEVVNDVVEAQKRWESQNNPEEG